MALTVWCASVFAQDIERPPEIPTYDDLGVDISSGAVTISLSDLSIGSGASALNHTIANYSGYFGTSLYGFWDDFKYGMAFQQYDYWTVTVGHTSTTFRKVNGVYEPIRHDGSSLVDNPNGTTTFTSRDGLVVGNGQVLGGGNSYHTHLYPNGFEVKIHHTVPTGGTQSRVQSVTTNTGLQFKYEYAANTVGSGTSDATALAYWPTKITAINNGVEYCDPYANSCTMNQDWPEVTYSWPTYTQIHGTFGTPGVANTFTVTDAEGTTTTYDQGSFATDLEYSGPVYEPRITDIKQSTSSGVKTTSFDYAHRIYCYSGPLGVLWECSVVQSNVVAEATRGSATWTYDYVNADIDWVTIATHHSAGPEGTMYVEVDSYGSWDGRTFPTDVSHPSGHSVHFSRDIVRRIESADYPAGNSASFEYDSRGNITKRTDDAGTTSTLDDSVTEAGYDPCTAQNFRWCNKPVWVEDAKNNRTDFVYDDAHGMVTKVTRPAPKAGAARPETRYFYDQYHAWYKNASGQIVQAASPVWLLEKESTCVLGAASGNGCANSNHEVITEYDYGTGSSSQANNLWLRGNVVKAYKNNFTTLEIQRTCYRYDDVGNVIAETLPAANLSSCD